MGLFKYYLLLQIIIINLNVENISAKTNVSNETDSNEDILTEIQELKKEVEKVRNDAEELKKLKKSYASMSHKVIELEEKIRALKIEDPGPNDVYFTVGIKSDLYGLAPGEIIKYDHVISNGGNGYDSSTGIFIAPTSGVYHFQFFCNSLKAKITTLTMMLNGNPEASSIVEPAYDGEDETGGNVFIARLTIGDEIWVEVYYAETSTTDLQANLNTFAGVLVHS